MRRRAAAVLLPLLALAAVPGSAGEAQEVRRAAEATAAPPARLPRVTSGVSPETVLVGQPFRTVLRVEETRGAVHFGELHGGDSLHLVARSSPAGAERPTLVLELVAWYPDAPVDARLPVSVAGAAGASVTYSVPLRLPVVRSVLPADTAGVVPRPARGPVPIAGDPSARGWWWAVALAAALLLALLAWLLFRRRSSAVAEVADPRERAIGELDALLESSAALPGEHHRFYPAATGILRRYLAAGDPRTGLDLTSAELVEQLGTSAPQTAARLRPLLGHADAVKFARAVPTDRERESFAAGIREVVLTHPPADVVEPALREAAA